MTPSRAAAPLGSVTLATIADRFVAAGTGSAGPKLRRLAAQRFSALFGDLTAWQEPRLATRLAVPVAVRGFAAYAAVHAVIPVDPRYVVASNSQWGGLIADRDPAASREFRDQADSLGFERLEIDKIGPNSRRSA